ncbi:probable RNA methyltransferase Y17G7B.18 isoform X2 [Patella vulgata]|nr:probable RNA methyltransferase Y17G7B.18 isoform X2 [Patella vulgata]
MVDKTMQISRTTAAPEITPTSHETMETVEQLVAITQPSTNQDNGKPSDFIKPRIRKEKHKPKFIHGNYNRYYGYRNKPESGEEDIRLLSFKREWFNAKDVLDIGCNVGHVTMTIAKQFLPTRMVGLDIDSNLISTARKNIKYYIDVKKENYIDVSENENMVGLSVPCSANVVASPINSGVLSDTCISFPENLSFKQGNYVLNNSKQLSLVQEEYDTILALSVTKWIHLNNGDTGIKMFFQRIFRHLRPGGRLILEPQPWTSYKKRKNLTLTIQNNFQNIELKPEHFQKYLLDVVGFSKCELIDVVHHKSKGFRRPIQMYTKC